MFICMDTAIKKDLISEKFTDSEPMMLFLSSNDSFRGAVALPMMDK